MLEAEVLEACGGTESEEASKVKRCKSLRVRRPLGSLAGLETELKAASANQQQ